MDKKGSENSMTDHLSQHQNTSSEEISDTFPDKQLLTVVTKVPWFAHITNYLVTKSVPDYWNMNQKQKFFHDIRYYIWEEPQLFHLRADQIIRLCVPEEEQVHILVMSHSSLCGGHFHHIKCCKVASIGQLYSRMPSNKARNVLSVNLH